MPHRSGHGSHYNRQYSRKFVARFEPTQHDPERSGEQAHAAALALAARRREIDQANREYAARLAIPPGTTDGGA